MKKTLKKASVATLAGIMAAAVPFTAMASEPAITMPDSSEQTEISAEITDEDIDALLNELAALFAEDTASDYSIDDDYNFGADVTTLEEYIFDILDQIGTEIQNALSEEQIQKINDAFDVLVTGVADHAEVFMNTLAEVFSDVSTDISLDEDDTNFFEMTPEEEAVYSQMCEVYDALDVLEYLNIDTWKKLYQNTTAADISDDFDESAFIIKSKNLTTDEKNVLLQQIEQEDTYQAQLSELQDELSAINNTDYSGGMSDEEQAAWNKILTFYNRAYAVRQANADLWEVIDNALNESDDYFTVIEDLASFINSLDTLTNEEKVDAIADNNLIDIFNAQGDALLDAVYDISADETVDSSEAVG